MEIIYNETWKGRTASIVVHDDMLRRSGFNGQEGHCELTEEEFEQCRNAALAFLEYHGKRIFSSFGAEPRQTHHEMLVTINGRTAAMVVNFPIEVVDESLPEVFTNMQQLLRKLCVARKSH